MRAARLAAAWFYRQPFLLLAVAGLSWAANVAAGKLAVGHVSPLALTGLRWLFVVIILAAAAGRTIVAEAHLLLPHWRYLFVMGALGYTAFNALFYVAAHTTTAVNIGVIQAIMPGLVLVGSLAVFGTRIRLVQVAGLAVTFVGILITVSRGDLDVLRTLAFNAGDLWMLLACLFYAGYTVALPNRPAVSPITFFAAMALSALLTSLPLVAAEAAAGALIWPDAPGWALVLFVALFPSFLAQLFFMRGVALIGPGRAGLFMNLVPVFAALFGVLLLGESFGLYHAVAMGLVLGGIWLAERGRSLPPLKPR